MTGYRVAPLGAAIDAIVDVPGSKSIANRALVCAALADGESVICNLPDGDDTQSMATALRIFGEAVTEVAARGAAIAREADAAGALHDGEVGG